MSRAPLAALLAAALAAAPAAAQTAPTLSPAEQSKLDGGIPAFTAADVRFMQGMIGHHGQAIVMANWAASHGARADVQRLAARIAVAQTDEIAFMQTWLRARKQEVPEPGAPHMMSMTHTMPDGTMMPDDGMLMPGMLTAAQLAELDAARGSAFDRLFLTFMIGHHQGAVRMVDALFASHGAAQDDDIFKFAGDVSVDQTTEVARMQQMLASVPDTARP